MSNQPTATRPAIASSYRDREPATMLTWSTADARLARAKSYWVVTTGPNGRPYPRPLWGLWQNGSLLFTVFGSTRTARNLAVNPYASVHLESADDALILEGVVTEVPLTELETFLGAWLEKYAIHGARGDDGTGDLDRMIYRLRPRRAYGWTLDARLSDMTRWTFPA